MTMIVFNKSLDEKCCRATCHWRACLLSRRLEFNFDTREIYFVVSAEIMAVLAVALATMTANQFGLGSDSGTGSVRFGSGRAGPSGVSPRESLR